MTAAKVSGPVIAGAVTTILSAILLQAMGYSMSAEVATAVTTLLGAVLVYLIPNSQVEEQKTTTTRTTTGP